MFNINNQETGSSIHSSMFSVALELPNNGEFLLLCFSTFQIKNATQRRMTQPVPPLISL